MNVDIFLKNLKGKKGTLLLDYDGTLAPFNVDPAKAFPYKGVEERLNKIQTVSRLVIISGRTLDSLRKMLVLSPMPELWGSHGAERWKPGTELYALQPIAESARQGLELVRQSIEKQLPGFFSEIKPASIAIHWRGRSLKEQKKIEEGLHILWNNQLQHKGLTFHYFDGGIEIKAEGISKKEVVEKLLQESSAQELFAYLGDDQADEEAFEALGNRGLKGLVTTKAKVTKADFCLKPPEELDAFLDCWVKAATEGH